MGISYFHRGNAVHEIWYDALIEEGRRSRYYFKRCCREQQFKVAVNFGPDFRRFHDNRWFGLTGPKKSDKEPVVVGPIISIDSI